MLELKKGMRLFTPGGEEVGRVNRFVLDPASNEVTHIVIQKGWLLPEDKVVPFSMVNSSEEEKLVLNEEVDDFDQLPSFEETHFVRATEDHPNDLTPPGDIVYQYAPGYYWYPVSPNLGYSGFGLAYNTWPSAETTRNIPDDTVPLKEGTDVISSDGEHVGDVERLILEPASNQVSDFVISQGLFFKERKLVPASWIQSVEEDKVYLVVPSRLLERLPAYQE
jgi:uncharacterized protein YrrD